MKHLPSFFFAVLLTACSTHKPPPEAIGSFRPINGAEQVGMASPDAGSSRSRHCPTSDKPAVCAHNTAKSR